MLLFFSGGGRVAAGDSALPRLGRVHHLLLPPGHSRPQGRPARVPRPPDPTLRSRAERPVIGRASSVGVG